MVATLACLKKSWRTVLLEGKKMSKASASHVCCVFCIRSDCLLRLCLALGLFLRFCFASFWVPVGLGFVGPCLVSFLLLFWAFFLVCVLLFGPY